MIRAPVGIVVALAFERRALGALGTDPAVVVGTGGIGARRAAECAHDLLARGAHALLSFGVATALDDALAPGTLVVPDAVIERGGARLEVDPGWRQRIAQAAGRGADRGPIAEAANVLADAAARHRLGAATGARAADMESAAVARVARAAGVPFAAVRAIADATGDRLPAAALAAVDAEGRLRVLAGLGALLGAPSDVPALVTVAMHGMRAAARLRGFAAAAAVWLPRSPGDVPHPGEGA